MARKAPTKNEAPSVELEVAQGLEDIALDELLETFGRRLASPPEQETGALRFQYAGNLGGMLALRTINAAYLVEQYPIPRPKAFLGHQHLTRLLEQIETARSFTGDDAFTTIHISAAGSGSSVMQRLLETLSEATGLTPDKREGDLLVRLRPATEGAGWEALVRLSPRPNATRDWRAVDVPGALNGAVAHAMGLLSDPTPEDRVLNALCGSGSLAIERGLLGEAEQILACDIDTDMLAAASANIEAAGLKERVALRGWNATDIPVSPGSFDVVLTDLPFGNRVGSHAQNVTLYPALLQEMARVIKREGRLVLITHDIKLMDAVYRDSGKWYLQQSLRVGLSGLHPKVYVLVRT